MLNWMAILFAVVTAAACASRASAEKATITGQVIDLGCYARNEQNTGMDHDRGSACALACVKWEGQPVGLLVSDGFVYQFAGGLVANNNQKIAPHLAHTVTVTGEVSELDGMRVLTADDVTMVSATK